MLIFRYALQLLSPSKINAEIESTGPIVSKKDIQVAQSLFIDAGRSAQLLLKKSSLTTN